MIVAGKRSFILSGAKSSIEKQTAGFKFQFFHEFSQNPKLEDAILGAHLFRRFRCDGVVAIGGGSAIDTAKSILAFQTNEGREKQLATGLFKLDESLPPLIAVPTTTGSGSDSTSFAVIYVDGTKYSLQSPELLPRVVFLDANFSDSLPADVVACTGFDALSQAVESFWARSATEESREYAEKAILEILKHLLAAVNSSDGASREAMLIAANMAGKAINISKTTAPHALSYEISKRTGLSHGHAVAITLGNFFEINRILSQGSGTEGKYARVERSLFKLIGVTCPDEARMFWYDLMKRCNLKTELDGLKGATTVRDLEEIVDSVNLERLRNHPLSPSRDMLIQALIGPQK
jgi:alcohol dehydrogenase class IV